MSIPASPILAHHPSTADPPDRGCAFNATATPNIIDSILAHSDSRTLIALGATGHEMLPNFQPHLPRAVVRERRENAHASLTSQPVNSPLTMPRARKSSTEERRVAVEKTGLHLKHDVAPLKAGTVLSFAKGHATRNDFVVFTDRHDVLNLSPEDVRYLADRRGGIGADGVLRVIKAGSVVDWDGDPDLWFMDYRNADGSLAEMCGNGLRVFVRYLAEEKLIDGHEIRVATRAGIRHATLRPDGRITVDMGVVTDSGMAAVHHHSTTIHGIGVNVGNPHVVVEVASEPELLALDLTGTPEFDTTRFPNGANLEIASRESGFFAMRVLERGVGETQSCGTGAVAVAWALSRGEPGTYKVRVPGGMLEVAIGADSRATLTGLAVIVARGQIVMPEDR